MSLFGTASSGVDPQTGTYLTKEQRVAMFRASQGRGSYGGGGKSGGGKKRVVDPQSSIVVVNKMTDVVQKLQTNFQESAQTVSDQAVQNKKSIEDLYKLIAAKREQELKDEKAETVAATKDRESFLRKAREGLVEGISSAFAGLSNLGRGVGKALSPVKGLFDKIREALGWLLAAFALKNLPTIRAAFEDFLGDLEATKSKLEKILKSTRGVWSILDSVLSPVKKLLGSIAKTGFKVAKAILDKGLEIGGKIVKSVFGFTKKVVVGLIDKIGPFVTRQLNIVKNAMLRLWSGFSDAIRRIRLPELPKPPSPDPPSSQKPKPPVDTPDGKPKLKPKGNWFTETFDKSKSFLKKGITKISDVAASGKKNLANLGGTISSKVGEAKQSIGNTIGNLKPNSEAVKAGWIEKALGPLKKIPVLESVVGGLKGGLKGMAKLLARMPVIGFAIDLALNTGVEGQDWTEAIIRALLSSTTGALGAAAGAKIGGITGAGLGTLVFPVAGTALGGAIGAGLGGIVGGILAGAIGDKAGAVSYEQLTGMEATSNKPLGSGFAEMITNSVTNFIGAPKLETKAEARGDVAPPEPTAEPTSTAVAKEDGILGGLDRVVETVGTMYMVEPTDGVEPKETAIQPLPKGSDAVEAVAPPQPSRAEAAVSTPSPKTITSGRSTPSGLSLSGGATGGSTQLNMVELPPTVTDLGGRSETKKTNQSTPNQAGRSTPSYSTRDEETNIYRAMALKIYQLVG